MTPEAGACAPDGEVLILQPHLSEVGRARRFVSCCCENHGVGADACDTATLLASETVANAFLHGRSEARIRVVVTEVAVRVEVADDNSRHPVRQGLDVTALNGRGLALVEMLAAAWGVEDDAYGKIVWFEVAVA